MAASISKTLSKSSQALRKHWIPPPLVPQLFSSSTSTSVSSAASTSSLTEPPSLGLLLVPGFCFKAYCGIFIILIIFWVFLMMSRRGTEMGMDKMVSIRSWRSHLWTWKLADPQKTRQGDHGSELNLFSH